MRRFMRKAHEGQVLLLVSLCMVVLLGFTATAVDVGVALADKRAAQNAVDASALSVARGILSYQNSGRPINSQAMTALNNTARDYMAANGFPTTSNQVQVAYIQNSVTVTVTHPLQEFLINSVYQGKWEVQTHAVASLEPTPKDYALLALRQTGNPIDMTGNMSINVIGGGAMSNGAIRGVGNGTFHADLCIDANKGLSKTGNFDYDSPSKNPTAPIVQDPLASVPPPPLPDTPTDPGGTSRTCSPSNNASGNNVTLTCQSGKYTSSISVTGNNDTVNFTGNSYSFSNADVRLTGNNPMVNFGTSSGNHIFYFNRGSVQGTGTNVRAVFWPGTYYFKSGAFNLTGSSPSIEFKPGKYTFYMDGSPFSMVGAANTIYPSASDMFVYMKNSDVSITGNTPDATMPPGIYYIDGGNIKLTGNNNVKGDNVFFYFANGTSWDAAGNTGYNFTASTTPLYPGMQPGLLWFAAHGNTGQFSMVGNTTCSLKGIVYLPDAELKLTGNTNGTWAEGQLIVKSMTVVGNTDMDVKYKKYVDINVPGVYLTE
jgi:hypothetical protein